MQPLSALSPSACANLAAVLTDIDDTLTTDGRLAPEAYAALADLQSSGLTVIPVTGRPAGWCDMIARFWPVDGVVGENGAFYFRYDHTTRTMRRHFVDDDATRAANRLKLDVLARQILKEVPGCALSVDQPYRIADLAIDFREDVAPLPREAIDRIVELFEAAGATAKVSSIHVNGWFGTYDKLGMSRLMLKAEFGLNAQVQPEAVLFAGDSPNDEPMFAAFPFAVGVANVLEHEARFRHLPAYITAARSGEGFVELARHLDVARQRHKGKL